MKHVSSQTAPLTAASLLYASGLTFLSVTIPATLATILLQEDMPLSIFQARSHPAVLAFWSAPVLLAIFLASLLFYMNRQARLSSRRSHADATGPDSSGAAPSLPAETAPVGQLYRSMILVQSATHRIPVAVDEICYFFRVGRHTFLRTFDRKDYLVPESLQQVQAMLDPACFFRVNRQLLMHYKAFRSYKPAGYGKLELDLHLAPPFPAIVSQVKAPAFRHWMQR